MKTDNSHALKISLGVKRRLATLKMVLAGNASVFKAVEKRNSIALSAIIAYISNKPNSIIANHRNILRLASVSFAYREYQDKINFSKLVKDNTKSKLVRYIAVGDTFLDASNPVVLGLSNADYSLFCRNPNYGLSENEIETHRLCFSRFFREHKLKHYDVKSVLKSYLSMEAKSNLFDIEQISIAFVQKSLRHISRRLWPISGSFAPHTIARLCDPEEHFDLSVYHQLFEESRSVLLDPVFNFIVALRSINNFDNASRYADSDYILQLFSSDRSLRLKFSYFFDQNYYAVISQEYKGRNVFSKIYASTIDIYSLINIGSSLNRIYIHIARLYEADQQAIVFLDWAIISSYIKKFPAGHSSLSIFVSILMTDPVIARRYPIQIGIGFGSGRANRQIFNRASEMFRTGQARKITSFMRSFLDLKGKARKHVFGYMADRAMSDRLYAVFSTNTTKNISYDEQRVSQARIDILNFICDHQPGQIDYFMKYRDEETNLLRGLHFKDMYGQGRIHLDLFTLQLEIEDIIFDEFNIKDLKDRKLIISSDAKILNHFAAVLSKRLVEHALLNSDYSVDAVLSNNLRHGVIEPRILSALNSACRNPEENEVIDPLRANVSYAVTRYMNNWLTLTEDGNTINELKEDLKETLKEFLKANVASEEIDISEIVIKQISKSLKTIVNQSHLAFSEQCVPEINTALDHHLTMNGIEVAFGERISGNLEQSYKDVLSWLAIADLRSSMKSFSVEDIARFEIDLFVTDANARRLSKIEVEKRRGSDTHYTKEIITLDIEYFESIYTVIHNLVSNAAKYSGSKHRTIISIRVRLYESLLTIQVRNSISSQVSQDEAQKNYRAAHAMAKQTNAQGAFKEGGTGFKKIRKICHRDFGQVQINVPPLRENMSTFLVEVTVPYGEGSLT